MQSARQAVRKLAGEALQASALAEIVRALEQGSKQVIYFAQDKLSFSNWAGFPACSSAAAL